MDEATLSRLVRVMPNLGHVDPGIRATAAEAAHRIVTDASDCWQYLLRQKPSPLQAEPVFWRHAVNLALSSERTDFEDRFLGTLLHWHGPPTIKQQATLENLVSRLVRGPIRLRF